MTRTLLKVQVAVLAIGTGFSWTTLVFDYRRFFASGGHVLSISGCAVTNPILTPCFYGALAFLAAFAWALAILRTAPDKVLKWQRRLQLLLAAGTAFAALPDPGGRPRRFAVGAGLAWVPAEIIDAMSCRTAAVAFATASAMI